MAKDDYYVIVYQILAYLYTQLKNGDAVNGKLLQHDSDYLNINQSYWAYVFEHMINDGYIERVTITKTWGGNIALSDLSKARITPKGISYLCDNSFLNKAKEFLKDTKAIVPFI